VRYDIVHRWAARGPHGAPVLSSTALAPGRHGVDGTDWEQAFTLARDPITWEYPASGTVRLSAVSALALRSVVGCRLSFRDESRPGPVLSAPELEDTAVDARLHDGTDAYVWDGATWEVAGADEWNTPAQLEAGAPSWDPSLSVGVELRLRTTHPEHTPVVFGMQQVWHLEFGARSGAHRRPDSWDDDAIVRTSIAWLRSLAFHRAHEVPVAAGQVAVDLSAVKAYDVAGVRAAYWLDTDPDLHTPVAGAFADGTFTLAAPRGVAARLHLDLNCRVNAVHLADADLVQAKLPVVLLSDLTSEVKLAPPGPWIVPLGDTGLSVRRPDVCHEVATLRIDAADAKDARAVEAAITADLGRATAKELVSAGTAQVVRAWLPPAPMRERPAQGGALLQRTGELRIQFERWRAGAAQVVPLVQEVAVGGDGDVTTDVVFALRAPVRVAQ